jgi:chitin disaccharide deacetylase
MRAPRRIVLCADDFARDELGSAAILRLADAGRLSAVSCFTDSPLWPRLGRALRDRSSYVYVGLHFNLTEPFCRGERPLVHWIARAIAAAIDRDAVRAHLRRQVGEFRRIVGRLPDYIDGHEHVHALPGIRSVVDECAAELAMSHPEQDPVRVRVLTPPFGATDAPLKRLVIQTLAKLGRHERGLATALNTGFGGDYSLDPKADYPNLFASWLAGAPDGGLIMCHPGGGADRGSAAAGEGEHAFLLSERCRGLLVREGVELARPTDRFPRGRRLTVGSTGT